MKLGSHMTDEQRARMTGGAYRGPVHHTPETRAKISASMKGKPSPKKGIPLSEDQKKKMSAAMKGRPAWNKGIPMTDEQRAMNSTSHMGYKASSESRSKQSTAQMGRIVSSETRARLSIAKKGCLNHFWNGGISPINVLIRNSPEYKAWRTAVFKRDKFTCQECGGHGGHLEAHHIHEFAQYPDERFVVENGKTLCCECHDKTRSGHINARA